MTEAANTAHCRCGMLSATCTGEPVRVSVCHCRDCQARSGSAFATQVRFPAAQVALGGEASHYVFTSPGGAPTTFHFCPACGTTVWYVNSAQPETVAIALGNFEDMRAYTPRISVWEDRKLDWVAIIGDGIAHYD